MLSRHDADVGAILNSLGGLHLERGNTGEAQEMFEQARSVETHTLAPLLFASLAHLTPHGNAKHLDRAGKEF